MTDTTIEASRTASRPAFRRCAGVSGLRLVCDDRIRILIIAAPVVVLAVLIQGGFYVDDPMFATGLAAVVAAFLVFGVFAARVPEGFDRLRATGVIPSEQMERFDAFLVSATQWMNGGWQLLAAALGAAAGFARFPIQLGGLDRLFADVPGSLVRSSPLRLADVAAETALGAIAGLVLLRMVVVGAAVFELGRRFDLRLKLNHPDGCGGFRPLGDICLLNASVITVPAVWLGAWIVLAPRMRYGSLYVGEHLGLLAVVTALAFAAFLVPLWTVHQEMLHEGARIRPEVDQLAEQIDRLSRRLIDESAELTADEATAISKDLEVRQATYQRIERIPTWPIDTKLAVRFGTSQLVPLLSLTGLSGPIVDAIGRLVAFTAPS